MNKTIVADVYAPGGECQAPASSCLTALTCDVSDLYGDAAQRIGQSLAYLHIDKLADKDAIWAGKINHAIIFGATLQLTRILFRNAGDEQPFGATNHLLADGHCLLANARLQNVQPLFVNVRRSCVRYLGSGRTGPSAVYEAEGAIKADVLYEFHRGGKICFRLSGETNDEIG